MTTIAEATKGVPRIEGNPGPSLRADHNALADWVRDNVHKSVTTTGVRDADPLKWAGKVVHTQDTNTLWLCTDPSGSGVWVPLGPAPTGVLTRASDFILTANTFVAVPFTTAPTLRGLTWAAGTNPSRITAVLAGNYLVSATNIQINSTGNGDVQLRVNGNVPLFPIVSQPNSSGAALLSFAIAVQLNAGDYIEVMARSTGAFPWIAANRVNVDLLAYR